MITLLSSWGSTVGFAGKRGRVAEKKTWKILFSKHRNPQSKVMFTPTVARNTDLPFWIDVSRQTNTGVLQLWRQTPRSCLMSPKIFIKCQMVSDFLLFSGTHAKICKGYLNLTYSFKLMGKYTFPRLKISIQSKKSRKHYYPLLNTLPCIADLFCTHGGLRTASTLQSSVNQIYKYKYKYNKHKYRSILCAWWVALCNCPLIRVRHTETMYQIY